jgi:hypothetical protein
MFMSSCEQLFICWRRLPRRLVAVLAALVSVWSMPQPASAHLQAEAPSHARAHAYLNSVFLINLKPIDWVLVERTLTTDLDGRILGQPASSRLQAFDRAAGTAHWQAIETAIVAKRPVALYAATN